MKTFTHKLHACVYQSFCQFVFGARKSSLITSNSAGQCYYLRHANAAVRHFPLAHVMVIHRNVSCSVIISRAVITWIIDTTADIVSFADFSHSKVFAKLLWCERAAIDRPRDAMPGTIGFRDDDGGGKLSSCNNDNYYSARVVKNGPFAYINTHTVKVFVYFFFHFFFRSFLPTVILFYSHRRRCTRL